MGFCVASTKNGFGQIVGSPAAGGPAFLHGLEQGRLGLGRRAVDFVGQQEVGEDGAGHELELAPARSAGSSWMMSVPVMSEGIRSGVNWMRRKVRFRVAPRVWTMTVLAGRARLRAGSDRGTAPRRSTARAPPPGRR